MTNGQSDVSAPTTVSAPPRTGPNADSDACARTRLVFVRPSSRNPFWISRKLTSGIVGWMILQKDEGRKTNDECRMTNDENHPSFVIRHSLHSRFHVLCHA